MIAKGAFGNVLKVKGREDGSTYALKVRRKFTNFILNVLMFR